jgi:NitT/TauT family transport system substrate-binding protein
MKKRTLVALLTLALASTMLIGCQRDSGGGSDDLPVLRVAVMPFYISAPIGFIIDNEMDIANGFRIEPVMFPTGAPMNEAIASDAFDVATIGGAFVFGVANSGNRVIANHIDGTGGNEIWAFSDNPMTDVRGHNPDFPEILGSPETVSGLQVALTMGTTSQFLINHWMDAIGVVDTDIQMVHMDFAQTFQAFQAGQVDVAALVSPYCFQTNPDTMVRVADLKQLNQSLYEVIVVTDRSYNRDEIREILPTFLRVLFEANDIMEADENLKFQAVRDWYDANGTSATDEEIRFEMELKPFITTEVARNSTMGGFEVAFAEFMVLQEMLEPDRVEVVRNNVTSVFLDEALR